VFKLSEINGFEYDEKTGKCRFFYNNKLIVGELLVFNRNKNEILIEKDV